MQIPGTVDSSPIYLHDVEVEGRSHDTFFVTTTYGITLAIDAASGKILWRFTPPTYSSYAGTAQITTMTPVADPGRAAIYAGAPDGVIRKLSVATGKVLWSTAITRDPTHEKLASALNYANGLVLAATDGYIGDAPPYQGHVVTLDPASGKIVGVWNSLCSDRHVIMQPSTCAGSRLGDLGPLGAGRRSGDRRSARRDRQRPVRREDELGRQRPRPLAGRQAAPQALDAVQPGAS